MPRLIIILNDQLSTTISSLQDCDKKNDWLLLCETQTDATYVHHHKKKLALIFSAMRHFALELEQQGYQLHYSKLDDQDNSGTLNHEVARLVQSLGCTEVIITHPSEYRVLQTIKTLEKQLSIPVDIREDDRFLCSTPSFAQWAGNRKQLRMEYFYRTMRSKYNILMDGNKPLGGKWNFDGQNRKPAKNIPPIPPPYKHSVDAITQDVMAMVDQRFNDHFGDLMPFHFAVTRKDALVVLADFIDHRLPNFGDYQDIMICDEPWLFHSHISFYINLGLLLPKECIALAEKAYHAGQAPLNAVEGFIRQILGWREYVRGIYWLHMPSYADQNALHAQRALPAFYWTGKTNMHCLQQCVQQTKEHAYAHHIQRLMVLGNFALLAGIDPKAVNEWFLIVYADAYEWVELPNVSGMILFADGGYLASKPYAAGGSYINKMSNYCKHCHFDVKQKHGKRACPFNYLYWDFLIRHRTTLANNPRIGMLYRTFDRMDDEKKQHILQDAKDFLNRLDCK